MTPFARRILAGTALVAGALAAVVPNRPVRPAAIDVAALARTVEREDDHVTALELAAWIKDRRPNLHVLDVRSEREYRRVPHSDRSPY